MRYKPLILEEQELRAAETVLSGKKYIGPDGIPFSTFNRVLALELEIVRDITGLSFATATFRNTVVKPEGPLYQRKHRANEDWST